MAQKDEAAAAKTKTAVELLRESKVFHIVSGLMVLGALSVVIGYLLPLLSKPGELTGFEITRGAVRSFQKLLELAEQAQKTGNLGGLELLGEDVLSLMIEATMIALVNAVAIGLLALGCGYAIVKYALVRRAAGLAVSLPVLIHFASVGWAVFRLNQLVGQGNGDAVRLVLDLLASGAGKSSKAFEPGVGLYLFAGGTLLTLIFTNVLVRLQRRAKKADKRAS